MVAAVTDLHVQVIATGADPAVAATVEADMVVCADGGADVAVHAGLDVDLVVGDLDSATPAALAAARRSGVVVSAEPDKDETDLELALAAARLRGATRITVHLGAGGRLDHQLANLAVLASARWAPAAITARVGTRDLVWVVRQALELPLAEGAPLALVPIGGPARVTSSGVRWPLVDEWLDPTAARGISNEVVAPPARIQVSEGVVLVVSSAQAT